MRLLVPLLAALRQPPFAADARKPPESPRPPTGAVNADSQAAPEIRIIQKTDQKVEEYRMNGRLYAIKVTPKIGLPYYLVDEDGSGKMNHIATRNDRLIIPQWVLVRF